MATPTAADTDTAASRRVELSGGQWAELRDPAEVTERQRRPVSRARSRLSPEAQEFSNGEVEKNRARTAWEKETGRTYDPDDPDAPANLKPRQYPFTEADLDAMAATNEAVVVAMVERWSLGDTVTAEALPDLHGHDYDRLVRACSTASAFLYLDVSAGDPTKASNGSAPHWRDTKRASTGRPQTPSASSGSSASD